MTARYDAWNGIPPSYTADVREPTRSILLLAIALLLPIIPFLAFGDRTESWFVSWTTDEVSDSAAALFVFCSLASDIFLPVPSSVICTFAGDRFGLGGGALLCWLGMTIGSLLGYALAFWFGGRFAQRQLHAATVEPIAERLGPFLVVLTRAVPVLAEATVLWLGCQRVSLRRIVAPLLLANAGIAVAYATLGKIAGQQGWLVVAMAISAALPLLVWIIVQRRLQQIGQDSVTS